MNLVQIQERLKDSPIQMLMAYANGSNPEVPPYLALGELNRRKRLEEGMKTPSPPQASVKDQIEQQVKLMQTMAGRQQEAMQRAGQNMSVQNPIAPASTPVTDADSFAGGGITRLRSNIAMANGGIVAFGGDEEKNDPQTGQQVSSPFGRMIDEMKKTFQESNKRAKLESEVSRKYGPSSALPGMFMNQTDADRENAKRIMANIRNMSNEELQNALNAPYQVTQVPPGANRNITSAGDIKKFEQEKMPPAPASATPPAPAPASDEPSREELINLLSKQSSPAAPTAPTVAKPSAPAPVKTSAADAVLDYAKKFEETKGPDYEKMLEEERKKPGSLLAQPAGSKFETLIDEIRAQDKAERERVRKEREELKSNRLMDMLTGGAEEMSRYAPSQQKGIAGILNALGSSGRVGKALAEKDRQFEKEQRALERTQDLAYAEMISKIEDARRAEAKGDLKDIYASREKAAEATRNFQKAKGDLLSHAATAESQTNQGVSQRMSAEASQVSANASMLTALAHQAQVAQGKKDPILERAAVLARLPENKNKTMTELIKLSADLPQGARYDANAIKNRLEADKMWEEGELKRMIDKTMTPEKLAQLKKAHYARYGIDIGGEGGVSKPDTSKFKVTQE